MDLLVIVEKVILSASPLYCSKLKYLNYRINWQDIEKSHIVPKETILMAVLPAGQRVDGWEAGFSTLILCTKMNQNEQTNYNDGNSRK